ncbi:hypothetical protein V9L05_04450 [Bernardetia sp. Wsw4-3y2]|uniref:hypothetical protein n=1 Tax=Bernardetia sp. Wsw4-3y2 TaxID=3127471 RepID=UPI0030CFFEDC
MKKLFHPLIPLFILFLLAGKYSYDTFFSEKYDEKTLDLLAATAGGGENVSSGYLYLEDKIKGSIKNQITEQGNPKKLLTIFPKLDSLEAIYKKYEQQFDSNKDLKALQIERIKNLTDDKFNKFSNQNYSIQNLNLQTLFTNYLKEIKQFDSFLFDKYKDYVFEENQTDKELENKYLKGRKIEILIHLARFKAELAQIYVQAVDTLVEEYVYFPETDKYENAIFRPIIEKTSYSDCKDCYEIEVQEIMPLIIYRDTTELRKQIETNVNYYFDEKGFLIIDEKNFDIKKLKLKWKLYEGVNNFMKQTYLEYGKEGVQYEK